MITLCDRARADLPRLSRRRARRSTGASTIRPRPRARDAERRVAFDRALKEISRRLHAFIPLAVGQGDVVSDEGATSRWTSTATPTVEPEARPAADARPSRRPSHADAARSPSSRGRAATAASRCRRGGARSRRRSAAATRGAAEAGTGDEDVAELARRRPLEPLELYFLRHADAGDPMTWPGDDADRPLSKKGRRQAKRLGTPPR